MSNARLLSPDEYAPALARLVAAGYAIKQVRVTERYCTIKINGPLGRFTWYAEATSGFGSQSPLEAAADGLHENLFPTPSPYVLDYFARVL